MFVEVFNNNGIKYLRLVEGIRIINDKGRPSVRKKVLLNIGPLSKFDDGKSDYVKRLKESFKNGKPLIASLLPFVNSTNLKEEYSFLLSEGDPDCIGHPKLYSHSLLERILEELGLVSLFASYKALTKIKFDLLGFFRLLTYGRVLSPASKFSTVKQNDDYYEKIVKEVYPYNIYDTLSFIYDYKKQIINRINTNIINKANRKNNLIFYDVTNFFFEIEENDDDIKVDDEVILGIRKRGVSKEYRPQPIVQMGLFMDEEGMPISIEIFPGNTLDHLTVGKALAKNIDNVVNSRYIFVGDRGICNYQTVCHLTDRNKGYIFSRSIKKSTTEEKNWIIGEDDYINVSSEFKYKSKVIKKTVKDENGEKREIVQKVVSYWSKSFYDKEYAENKSFLEFLDKLITSPASFRVSKTQAKSIKSFLKKDLLNSSTGEIINSNSLKAMIDLEKIDEYKKFMGYYQIVTSELNMDDLEVIEKYHGLSQIENQFRIMKSDLQTRPIFVRNKEHIEAHLIVCMIALLILRIIQKKIVGSNLVKSKTKSNKKLSWQMGLTGERIQRALHKWTIDKLPGDYYRFNNLDDSDLKLILDAFKIKIPVKLYRKLELKNLKTSIKIFD
ncbi:MAG: IS1634 family transposase [Crenarchaeota archaeon]|nr:IS1634 family transposase [Thermoproteota archaeon]